MDQIANERQGGSFIFFPGVTAGGVLARADQIVGARPNGPNEGAVVYLASGPSIYTALSTQQLANLLRAELVEGRR